MTREKFAQALADLEAIGDRLEADRFGGYEPASIKMVGGIIDFAGLAGKTVLTLMDQIEALETLVKSLESNVEGLSNDIHHPGEF